MSVPHPLYPRKQGAGIRKSARVFSGVESSRVVYESPVTVAHVRSDGHRVSPRVNLSQHSRKDCTNYRHGQYRPCLLEEQQRPQLLELLSPAHASPSLKPLRHEG